MLQISLNTKESEFKTLKQENEQNLIKINTLVRTQEDEKSKANALKTQETKLNQEIAHLNATIADLKKENDKLDGEKSHLNEACSKWQSENRDHQSNFQKLESEFGRLQKQHGDLDRKQKETQIALDTHKKTS